MDSHLAAKGKKRLAAYVWAGGSLENNLHFNVFVQLCGERDTRPSDWPRLYKAQS